MRYLNLVLGDQLDHNSTLFEDLDPQRDALWMAELDGEITHVKHHQKQIVVFLAAMRHFAAEQERLGRTVHYRKLPETPHLDRALNFREALKRDLISLRPASVRVVRPGDRRVLRQLEDACAECGVELRMLEDHHFFSTPADFAKHAQGRKTLRLEYFYRELRKSHGFLLDEAGNPVGGQWNYDAENRESFGPDGPPKDLREPLGFPPTATTVGVCRLVEQRYPDHPGSATDFNLAVTREQALQSLEDFLENRLPNFGKFQDAMWTGRNALFHSHLSTSLNLKLLNPAEVCRAAESAFLQDRAPLAAVEGFIRQILGWREFVRGIYWSQDESYRTANFLDQQESLPAMYWTGKTDMVCLREALQSTLEDAYSHHIQRLMVTGLYCLLYGVRPQEFNDWHLATHRDAIDWVSTPNVIGMSQYADGGLLASKPYCASGAYISRMSNYCRQCRYDPKRATGPNACPMTTLYWDFLARHEDRLRTNPRLKFQFSNLKKKSPEEMMAIKNQAEKLRERGQA